ncbi:unnamed protein product [Caenorhabditis nigoni]
MDSEDVDYNQAQADAQPDAQLSPSNDFQCLVLTPTVYLAVVQPFKDKIAEQQKVIEKLEEKNRELLKPIAQEPILPSPTTSSNPFAVRDAPVSNDNPERMESTGRMKSFSENSTDMFSSLLAMVQRYDELERENGGLRLESESTKSKLKDKDNELKRIQTEMITQKNELNALKQNWANERTRLTTDHAHQLRQMEDSHQICLNRISTQHVETLRIKEEANLTTLAQKEQLITALRRSGEQLETSHEAQKSRWGEERDGLQSELQEKQAMVDALVETKNGLIEETKELKEEYLKAAVYQNKASIAEWSAVENIIGGLSSTIRSSLKCQFRDLQEALDLCRETKEKYEKSLDENLECQKKRIENAHGKDAEVGGEQGSSAETKVVKSLPLLSRHEEEEAAQEPKPIESSRPSRKRGAEDELVTFGGKARSL